MPNAHPSTHVVQFFVSCFKRTQESVGGRWEKQSLVLDTLLAPLLIWTKMKCYILLSNAPCTVHHSRWFCSALSTKNWKNYS